MTPEADLIAALKASPLLAGVVSGVFLNAADERTPMPYIVLTSNREYDKMLEGHTDLTHLSYTLACWGQSSTQAEAVADKVEAMIDAADSGVEVLTRTGGFDPATAADVSILLADEWR